MNAGKFIFRLYNYEHLPTFALTRFLLARMLASSLFLVVVSYCSSAEAENYYPFGTMVEGTRPACFGLASRYGAKDGLKR